MSAVVAAMVVGAACAKLLYDTAPFLAWLTATGLCGGLFGLARLFARTPTRLRFLALVALVCLACSYLLVLGGESAPRPVSRGALGFVTLLVMLIGVAAAAVALPGVLVAAALRRRGDAEPPQVRLNVTAQVITFSLGAATCLLGIVLLAVTIWASPAQWRSAAMVAVFLATPVLLLPFWRHIYLRLLSRWEVTRPPRALLEGIETLRHRTGFGFDRILCLEARVGGGRVCQVITGPGRSTLVLSESIPDELTTEQLLAILAHEAAHVRLNHLRRKLAWGALGAVVALTTAVVAQMLIAPLVPRALGFVGVLVVLLPITVLRGLYDTFVVRRHEAEADDFAVDVAGATALLNALGVLGASGPPEALVHNRWTTHSTWEGRASRIRECEKSRMCNRTGAG